ncbi:hypothetical protein LINPERPRIM_LOCUS27767 [Linum perenne]
MYMNIFCDNLFIGKPKSITLEQQLLGLTSLATNIMRNWEIPNMGGTAGLNMQKRVDTMLLRCHQNGMVGFILLQTILEMNY